MSRTIHTIAKPRSLASSRGEEGVTLLELMIAMTVGIVVIIAVSQTMMNAGKSAISVRMDVATQSILSQISQIIRDPVLCSRAFFDDATNTVIDVNPASLTIPVTRFAMNGAQIARTGHYVNGVKI